MTIIRDVFSALLSDMGMSLCRLADAGAEAEYCELRYWRERLKAAIREGDRLAWLETPVCGASGGAGTEERLYP